MVESRSPPSLSVDGRTQAWNSYWEAGSDRLGTGPGGFARWCLPFLTKVAPGPRVLELGTGAGRDLQYFVEEGLVVDGVDSSHVALEMARTALARLPESVQTRAKLIEDDALRFLAAPATGSYDSIVGIVLYETMAEDELEEVFDRIHSRLRPGGIHLWCVRSTEYPLKSQPWLIPPNRGSEAARVPHRLFNVGETETIIRDRFERMRLEDVSERHYLYISDRRVR
ncbi:MAG: class I SAM-dependent methyltransferase [Thermoplasmata archaeon]